MSKFGKRMFEATQSEPLGAPQTLIDAVRKAGDFEIMDINLVQPDSDSTFVADSTTWMEPAIK